MDLPARLDPELAEIFPHLPVLDLTDIATARTTMMDMLAAAQAGARHPQDVIYADHLVPGLNGAPQVRVRLYRSAGHPGPVPCLYWIHGGGHVLGQIEQDDLMMEHIVEAVGCAAVSVEWRRPPEDIEYAQRLQQADVPTELHVYPGGIHGFDLLAPASGLARRFVRDRDDALRRAFSP